MVYVYAGYPIFLAIGSFFYRRAAVEAQAPYQPMVTLVISAFNEADCIEEKIENSLSLDYPKEKLDVVVVSDASDDGTDEIVQKFGARGVRLLRMNERGGKTLGLNAAVASSTSEILVFSDANAIYREDAIARLAENFVDPEIGAVIGESSYSRPETDSGRAESTYWNYEVAIKAMESRFGSVVGGDGAIYAVRRRLYEPMAADALSDFVNPLQVVRAGYRCIYDPRAVSYEEAAASFEKEYRRKVRIVNRAWRAMMSLRSMLNPVRYGWFSIKLWSHKVLRWLVPAFMASVFVLNILLIAEDKIYVAILLMQLLFYATAWIGHLTRGRKQPLFVRIPYYFCLVNAAAAVGIIEAISGKAYTTWTTARIGD